jgi:hypothetical protein
MNWVILLPRHSVSNMAATVPSGISDMQTTLPRLSKLIAASPPGKFSRRRQRCLRMQRSLHRSWTTKLNRGVSILRTRIEMIPEVNFPVKSQRLVIRQPIRRMISTKRASGSKLQRRPVTGYPNMWTFGRFCKIPRRSPPLNLKIGDLRRG